MLRSQASSLIDWSADHANGEAARTKRTRLTREELNAKISYPIYKKKQERLEPLRTDIGRRALEIFHSQKRAFGISNSRLRAGSSSATGGPSSSTPAAAAAANSTTTAKSYGNKVTAIGGGGERSGSVVSSGNKQIPTAVTTAGGTLPPHPFTPIADLPNLPPSKLDEELTRCLEAVATGGASEGGYSQTQQSHSGIVPNTAAAAAANRESFSEAQTYLRAAIILQLKERYSDALEYFSKCVTVDPLLTECYLHRAQCLSKLEDPAAAVDEYKKYLQMEPATKALLADCGKCALDAGRLEEAEQLFHACLSIGAPSSDSLAADDLTMEDGTIVAAGSASVAALLLRNRRRQIMKVMTMMSSGDGHHTQNTAVASDLVDSSSNSTNKSRNGYAPRSQGATDGRGYQNDEEDEEGHRGAGMTLGGAGEEEEEESARPAATADAARNPNEWNITDEMDMPQEDEIHDNYCFYNLGELEERRGNLARANDYYKKVHPSFAVPYFEQGKVEFAEENYSAALRLFEAVAKVLPDEVSVHLWLADTYTALGIDEFSLCVLSCLTKAIALPEKVSTAATPEIARQLLAEDPDSKHLETTLLRRGMLYLNILNDLDNALRDFTVCLTHNRENAEALLARARTLLQRNRPGDEELAAEDYKLVVTLPFVAQSDKAQPYEVLGLYHEKKKKYVEAGRYFALAICCGAQPNPRSFYRCATYYVSSTSPTVVNGGEELPHRYYDPRGWVPSKAGASGDRAGADGSGLLDGTRNGGGKGKSATSAGSGAAGGGVGSLSPLSGGMMNSVLISPAVAAAAFAEGGGGVPRSAAVSPLSYSFIDAYYDLLRGREPTVHRSDECSAIDRWAPIRSAVDKRKTEAEAAKNSKKKKR